MAERRIVSINEARNSHLLKTADAEKMYVTYCQYCHLFHNNQCFGCASNSTVVTKHGSQDTVGSLCPIILDQL